MRFGRYLYGFQTHMEFDREIVTELHEKLAVDPQDAERLPYVQTDEVAMRYDYTEMNALLSDFLDAMTADYLGGERE